MIMAITRAQSHRPNQRGFTLIELVVVMLIISLVIGIAVVMFSRFNDRHSLLSKADQTVAILKYCHRYAMFNQTGVRFTLKRRGYHLSRQSADQKFHLWTPFPNASSTFSYLNFRWHQNNNTGSKRLVITFHADGSISAPINIPFQLALFLGDTPTHLVISLSTQGAISVKQKGKTIES